MPEKLYHETLKRKLYSKSCLSWPKFSLSEFQAKVIKDKHSVSYSDQEFIIRNHESATKTKIKSQLLHYRNSIQSHNEAHIRASYADIDSVIINMQCENDFQQKELSAERLRNLIMKEREDIIDKHKKNSK